MVKKQTPKDAFPVIRPDGTKVMVKKPIFKETRPVKLADGTTVREETEWWYIRWTDASGRRRKLKAAKKVGMILSAFNMVRTGKKGAQNEKAA